jgi:uncharacterized membrane protein
VIAIGFAVRVYRLGHENFWVDEVYQVRVASQPLLEIVRNYHPGSTFGESDQAPLSMMVSHLFVADRRAEFWARFPSAVFGALGVLALFLVSRLLLPFAPSVLAALFLALSPLSVWYSQEARWYSQWGLVSTLSYLALMRAEKKRSLASWIAYGIATVVSLYTFIYAVFVIVAQGLSLVWRQRTEGGSWRPLAVFSVVMLAALIASAPVVTMIAGRVGLGKVYSGTPRSSSVLELPYTFFSYCSGFTLGPTIASLHDSPMPRQILRESPEVGIVFALFIPLSLLGIWRTAREPSLAAWLVPWLVMVPLLVFLTSLILTNMTYQVRYTFVSLPAFTLVLSIGVFALESRLRLIAAGAVVTLSLYSLVNLYWSDRYDKADVRRSVAHMRSSQGSPSQVVVAGQIRDVLPYYADREDGLAVAFCGPSEYEGHGFIDIARGANPDLGEEVDTSQGIWLVAGRDWADDHESCLQILSDYYVPVEYVTFTGIELWRLEPLPSSP